MTVKQCGGHGSNSSSVCKLTWPYICLIFVSVTLLVTSLVILLTWAILRPSNPRFNLQDATVFSFNVSGNPPNLLTSSFQFTISSRNPNGKSGIHYDRLDVYASYQSQQITYAMSIPPTYQGHKEVNVWSPLVGGNSVPVAPYIALSLDQEQTRDAIKLDVHIDGRVRWKVGAFTTWTYHLHVRCPAFINSRHSAAGVKYTLTSTCDVSV